MLKFFKNIIQNLLNFLGYRIVKKSYLTDVIIDNDKRFMKIYDKCKDFTMTSRERMYALYKAVEYVIKADIPGDFVECGVWKGGSSMLIALTLLELRSTNRKIYLYDTFEGMTKPCEDEFYLEKKTLKAIKIWKQNYMGGINEWCYASLSEVEDNMYSTEYPRENLVFIKGKVEETIPKIMPLGISILRLDTDWYESTKHELVHLFPLLFRGGVLIIDDYGSWSGSKRAVDEYFSNNNILLNRIDTGGRIGVKI